MLLNYNNVEIRQDDALILKDISLCVNSGDYVFITGKVGSGKSTLLSTIYGELRPLSGEAQVLDYDMLKIKPKQLPALRKQLGMVFQSFQLLNDRTVRKNMEFVLKATGWKVKDEIQTRIQEVLSKVEMLDKIDKYPYELSGGQQQRVSIARAVMAEPELLLADEPTGNLDSKSTAEIMELFKRLNEEKGLTILQVTHSADTAEYGNRIIRLDSGKVVG